MNPELLWDTIKNWMMKVFPFFIYLDSNGNSTIKEHESEDFRESETFTRQSQDLINMQSSNALQTFKEDEPEINEDNKYFDNEDMEADNINKTESEQENKSVSSCSSTESKVSAHPELFQIKINEVNNEINEVLIST